MVIFLTGVGFHQLLSAVERNVGRDRYLEALSDVVTIVRGPKPLAAMKEVGLTPTFRVPEPNTWRELLTTIDKKPRVLNRQKAIMGKQKACICTHQAANRYFVYSPAFDLDAGITQTFEWYRREGWL